MHHFRILIFCLTISFVSFSSQAAYLVTSDDLGARISIDLEAGGGDGVTDREVEEFLAALRSRIVRARVWLYHAESVEEVKSALVKAPQYTEGELSSFLWGRFRAVPRACLTGAVLAAGYVCTNYALAHYSDQLPTILASSVPGLMTTLSISFLTPILQPVIATATKSAFQVFKSNNAKTGSVTSEKLNLIWYATSGRLSMNEEMARNTFIEAYNTIQVGLSGIGTDLLYLQLQDPYFFLVNRVAETIRIFAALYVDLGPRDLGLDLMVKARITTYRDQDWFRQEFRQDLERRIQDIDPLGYQNQDQQRRYQEILSAWIGGVIHRDRDACENSDGIDASDLTRPFLRAHEDDAS
jgi:hypothetical protein